MGINKVQYGNTTLIDLTADTVTADKLMQGYTAHDRSGALITGTATGGGSVTQDQDGYIVLPSDGGGSPSVGGLEYEKGTFTPSADISRPTISFTNVHPEAPVFITISDVSDYETSETYSNIAWSYVDVEKMFGTGFPYSATAVRYGYYICVFRQTSSTTSSCYIFSHSSSESNDTTTGYPRYWATESGFKPYTNSDSRYWREGRSYKWLAVWKPTT